MKFIKDDQRNTLELRVTQRHAGQHPFRDHLQPGGRADSGIRPGSVTNSLPHRLTELGSHKGRHGAGGNPTGLQHQNPPRAEAETLEK